MVISSTVLALLLLFLSIHISKTHAELLSCAAADEAALIKFKSSLTKDTNRVLSSWISSRHCCKSSWFGVKCNRTTGRVTHLDLSGQELYGTIHPSLGSLSHLIKLDLSYNNFTGVIPSSLTNLTNLQHLDLAYNYGLTGPLPHTIGNMKSLFRLRLQSNKLSGTIPSSFGMLANLVYCELDHNMLQGPVPDSFTRHTSSLALLELSNNKLTGLPKDLSNLKRLGILYMGSNPLTFQSIAGIAKLPFLGELHLSKAGLKGPIPSWLSGLNLRQSDDFLTTLMDLSGNSITGHIPASIGNMTTLEILQLEKNKLVGAIPRELLNLQDLRFFNVSYNKLQGEIPQGPPFSSMDPSSFASNPGLCGRPLRPCKKHPVK